jgi:hypothetical protein
MQEYILFFLQSILLFFCDTFIYCATNYQLTYMVLVYYCVLLIKKSNFIKIVFLFMLLLTEQWFFYGHSFLATIHIPLAYIIWYRHHQYLYFNAFLFMWLCMSSLSLQLIIEQFLLATTPLSYIYFKLCGMLFCIWYGMYILQNYTVTTKKGR